MKRDLRAKLHKLGVTKGAGHLKPKRPLIVPPVSAPSNQPTPFDSPPTSDDGDLPTLAELFPRGRLEETVDGQACFVTEQIYPLTYQHGLFTVGQLLAHRPEVAAQFTKDERLVDLSFSDFLFVDTETTGLGGSGTFAFMVGVAYFEHGALIVRQYFLRDHGDEGAMLMFLSELLQRKSAVISFNGRSFDLPLLDTRFLMNRVNPPQGELVQMPHIDLLQPSRRIWRRRLDSCRLGSLEEHVLGVNRTHEDVPGSLIPYLYNQYLREGDLRPLRRVFYHNQLDMLSMVTLATRLLQLFVTPSVQDHPLELLGLGAWKYDLGLYGASEHVLHLARERTLPVEVEQQILVQLTKQLKKQDRRIEAIPLWEQIAIYSQENVSAHIELAKYYEWHELDLKKALNWTQQAAGLLDSYAPYERILRQDIEKRLIRLQRKLRKLQDIG